MFEIFTIDPVFGIIWATVFFGGIALFIIMLVKGIARERNNSRQPVKTAEARVVGKRIKVSGDPAYTHYFATFEAYNSERTEFVVEEGLYGLLVEGDTGMLTYQGYKALDFRRF